MGTLLNFHLLQKIYSAKMGVWKLEIFCVNKFSVGFRGISIFVMEN